MNRPHTVLRDCDTSPSLAERVQIAVAIVALICLYGVVLYLTACGCAA